MSIEKVIEANTAALVALAAAIQAALPQPAPAEQPAKPKPAPKPVKETPPAEEPAAPATLDYKKDVQEPMYALAKLKGSPVVRDIISAFKVKRADELKPDQWPEFIAKLKAATDDPSTALLVPADAK